MKEIGKKAANKSNVVLPINDASAQSRVESNPMLSSDLDKTNHDTNDSNKPFLLESVLEHDVFPVQLKASGLKWNHFIVPFASLDRELDEYITAICEEHPEE